jgi:membrane protease YdiL (CAAX protease family)
LITEAAVAEPAPHRWRIADAVVVGLVLLLVYFCVLFTDVWFQIHGRRILPPWVRTTPFQRSQLNALIVLVGQLGALSLLGLATAKARGIRALLSSVKWNANAPLGMPVIVGLGLAGMMTYLLAVVSGHSSSSPERLSPVSILLYVVASVVVGAFVEECYFRGICFIALSDKVGEFGAAAVTTILFALYHPAYGRLWLFLLVGLALVVVRIKMRSVFACFVVHAAYNIGILAGWLASGR